jgi:hypothetical protein
MLGVVGNWTALAATVALGGLAFLALYVIWLRRIGESDQIAAAVQLLPAAESLLEGSSAASTLVGSGGVGSSAASAPIASLDELAPLRRRPQGLPFKEAQISRFDEQLAPPVFLRAAGGDPVEA